MAGDTSTSTLEVQAPAAPATIPTPATTPAAATPPTESGTGFLKKWWVWAIIVVILGGTAAFLLI